MKATWSRSLIAGRRGRCQRPRRGLRPALHRWGRDAAAPSYSATSPPWPSHAGDLAHDRATQTPGGHLMLDLGPGDLELALDPGQNSVPGPEIATRRSRGSPWILEACARFRPTAGNRGRSRGCAPPQEGPAWPNSAHTLDFCHRYIRGDIAPSGGIDLYQTDICPCFPEVDQPLPWRTPPTAHNPIVQPRPHTLPTRYR